MLWSFSRSLYLGMFGIVGRGFHCVSCAAALVKIDKRKNNDVSWQVFRATLKLLLLHTVVLGFRVWKWFIPAEIDCQCHRQIIRRGMCMQPAAICFSVMVRPNDSQTGHSVTQFAARGGGCWGQEACSRKHGKKRCHIMKTSQKSRCKWNKPCGEIKTSSYEDGRGGRCYVSNNEVKLSGIRQ